MQLQLRTQRSAGPRKGFHGADPCIEDLMDDGENYDGQKKLFSHLYVALGVIFINSEKHTTYIKSQPTIHMGDIKLMDIKG